MQFENRMAIPGLRLKSTPEDVRSLPHAGTTPLETGTAVSITATGETCDVAGTTNEFGIVVFHHVGKTGKTADGKEEAYIRGDVVPVMTKGRIWVKPAATITTRGKAAKVYVKTANATADAPIGSLSATATDSVELVGAFWDVPSNADGLAVVDLG